MRIITSLCVIKVSISVRLLQHCGCLSVKAVCHASMHPIRAWEISIQEPMQVGLVDHSTCGEQPCDVALDWQSGFCKDSCLMHGQGS